MRMWSIDNVVIISEMTAPDDFVEIWSKDKIRTICKSSKTRFKNIKENEVKKVTEKLFIHSQYKDLIK